MVFPSHLSFLDGCFLFAFLLVSLFMLINSMNIFFSSRQELEQRMRATTKGHNIVHGHIFSYVWQVRQQRDTILSMAISSHMFGLCRVLTNL